MLNVNRLILISWIILIVLVIFGCSKSTQVIEKNVVYSSPLLISYPLANWRYLGGEEIYDWKVVDIQEINGYDIVSATNSIYYKE